MKNIVKVLALVLALALLSPVCFAKVTVEDYDFDWTSAIADFGYNGWNMENIKVGETRNLYSHYYAKKDAFFVSQDESIVEIDENGILTAKKEGMTYVVLDYGPKEEKEPELLLYSVFPAENTQSTLTQENGQVWMEEQREEQQEWLEEQREQQQEWLKEQQEEQSEILEKQEKVQKRIFGIGSVFATIFLVFWISLVILLLLFILIPCLVLSSSSTNKKALPPRIQTPRTIPPQRDIPAACPKCGAPWGEGDFCAKCGTSKIARYEYRFPISGHWNARKLEKEVNAFLAENPYLANCKLKVKTSRPFIRLISPFVNHKFYVDEAVLSYSLSQKANPKQYGMQFLYKFWLFGPFGYSEEKLTQEWQKKNPESTLVSSTGSRIQHLGFSSGLFFAQYYSFVFFKR